MVQVCLVHGTFNETFHSHIRGSCCVVSVERYFPLSPHPGEEIGTADCWEDLENAGVSMNQTTIHPGGTVVMLLDTLC